MKRSEINQAYLAAVQCFQHNGWALPPNPHWDITDFGLGDFKRQGLVLINLADEPEYVEKLMYGQQNQVTPLHYHKKKKEDIICRAGRLAMELWAGRAEESNRGKPLQVQRNGERVAIRSGDVLELAAGERVTLLPGINHAFWPLSAEAVLGEVSTANDDEHDNFFQDSRIGRFPPVEEDEQPLVKLLSDQ